MCGHHTHIIRDYKNLNLRVNTRLALLLYTCVAYTHEPTPSDMKCQVTEIVNLGGSQICIRCCLQSLIYDSISMEQTLLHGNKNMVVLFHSLMTDDRAKK